jgi:hypothetical protein
MPAEAKRSAEGVYLMFLKGQVTEDEIATTVERCNNNAAANHISPYIVVVDPIQVYNPLQVGRWLAKHTSTVISHYIIVGNGRDSSVIAERLNQKLPHTTVENAIAQNIAVERAVNLLGVTVEDDAPACDYL